MVGIIDEYPAGTKFIVFSQWTTMLDVCETLLKRKSVKISRFDGTISSTSERANIIQNFNTDPTITVLLCSLRAGGAGVTLTGATVVIFMDPWWNASKQQQAEDRVNRIGQTKPVTIHYLYIRGSIEEQVLDIQRRKAKMGTAFLTSEPTIEELHSIFEQVNKRTPKYQHVNSKDGSQMSLFNKIVQRTAKISADTPEVPGEIINVNKISTNT